jgi:murein L,D-transpeptidase YcbB/YkuD
LGEANDRELVRFYEARGFRPVWFDDAGARPAARRLLALVGAAAEHGLEPSAYPHAGVAMALSRADQSPEALADADVALTRLLVKWAGDLHTPAPGAATLYTDPALSGPPQTTAEILGELDGAGAPDAGLARLSRMNPIYEELRASWREAVADGRQSLARDLRANMERARGLRADLGERYVLVNVAAQTLEVWAHGQRLASMPVVVGKRTEPTPMLAGVIRFAVLNPYWHMPPDLAAERVAPLAVREDAASVLARQDLELVSSFAQDASVLDPATVDWPAVSAGEVEVHLRQRPGPHNMMGQVKFIFPNKLGVYLHDTPLRAGFNSARRTESAGCVRVSDSPRLMRLLIGPDADLAGAGQPEERVDLPEPAPVYLVYFTLRTPSGVIERHPDLYGRDADATSRSTGNSV